MSCIGGSEAQTYLLSPKGDWFYSKTLKYKRQKKNQFNNGGINALSTTATEREREREKQQHENHS